jgi:hypothetical protein
MAKIKENELDPISEYNSKKDKENRIIDMSSRRMRRGSASSIHKYG